MVVFLLFCGLHNEAGDSKFRNRRQYIAYVGHVGGFIKRCIQSLFTAAKNIIREKVYDSMVRCLPLVLKQFIFEVLDILWRYGTCTLWMGWTSHLLLTLFPISHIGTLNMDFLTIRLCDIWFAQMKHQLNISWCGWNPFIPCLVTPPAGKKTLKNSVT